MPSSRSGSQHRFIVDAIHGDIHLTESEVKVIDTPSFQRLRQLKQLAMAQLVFPTASHTRFSHGIGALGIMDRILRVAKDSQIELRQEDSDNLRLAALLHDIGHYPYSHLMEKVDKVRLIEEEIEEATVSIDGAEIKYPSHVKV